jgi:hypothetical protein
MMLYIHLTGNRSGCVVVCVGAPRDELYLGWLHNLTIQIIQ